MRKKIYEKKKKSQTHRNREYNDDQQELVGKIGEGNQRVQISNYKMNKFWGSFGFWFAYFPSLTRTQASYYKYFDPNHPCYGIVSWHAHGVVEPKNPVEKRAQPNEKSKATPKGLLSYFSWLYRNYLFTHFLAYLFISFLSHQTASSRIKDIGLSCLPLFSPNINRVTQFY